MKRNAQTFFALVVLHCVTCGSAVATCPQPSKAKYTDANGTIKYVIPFDEDGERKNAEVRALLWCYWHERRPGTLVVKWFSLEGRVSDYTFVLESDNAGQWSLRVGIDREQQQSGRVGHNEFRAYSRKE